MSAAVEYGRERVASIDAVRIHEMRSLHPEGFRERIHLADKNRDRCSASRRAAGTIDCSATPT